jgi:hypothetical protein
MNILEVSRQLCYRTHDNIVQTLFSNIDSSSELVGFLSLSAQNIFSAHAWSRLRKDATIHTSGSTDTYVLPSDFDSILTYNLYNISTNRVIRCEQDDGTLAQQAWKNTSQNYITFRIMGGKIVFAYPIDNGMTLKYTYKSKNFVRHADPNTGLSEQDYFSADADEFLLDNELLILGAMVARSIELEFEDEPKREQIYLDALEKAIGKDGGKMSFNLFGGRLFNKTTPLSFAPYGD